MLGYSPLSTAPLSSLPSAGGPISYTDSLSSGAYSLVGKDITDVKTSASTAYADSLSVGIYVISGNTVSDSRSRADSLSVGNYVVSGNTVSDSVVRADSLSVGAYTVSGKTVSDVVARADNLSVGNYVVSGKDITDVITTSGGINYADSLLVGSYIITGSNLTDELIQQVSDEIQGQGNWYKTRPKFRIKLVKKLTKELEQVIAKKEEAIGIEKTELIIYEALLHEKLAEQFDESLKNLVTEIEYKKTEKILNEIKLSMENKKLMLQLEEEEVMFAIMLLLE